MAAGVVDLDEAVPGVVLLGLDGAGIAALLQADLVAGQIVLGGGLVVVAVGGDEVQLVGGIDRPVGMYALPAQLMIWLPEEL